MSQLARIAVERRGQVTLARLAGEVDLSNAGDIRAELVALGQAASVALIVDLNGIEYFDSAGFSALEGLALERSRQGGALRLVCAPTALLRRTLEISGLDRLVPLDAAVADALAALATSREVV